MPFPIFEGNCPRNVNRDAKYTVRYDEGEYVVGLVYQTNYGERWYPTTGNHTELVELVNRVKIEHTGSPGGSFYINEYHHVVVPTVGEREYRLAGRYERPISFEFEGKVLSGDAVDLTGAPLEPGKEWLGPHPGIPYVLAAGARDIYYDSEPRPRVRRRVKLSDRRDRAVVQEICRDIVKVKGFEGGRFYINEFLQFFTPVSGEGYIEYVYIGRLSSLSEWFPDPHSDA